MTKGRSGKIKLRLLTFCLQHADKNNIKIFYTKERIKVEKLPINLL